MTITCFSIFQSCHTKINELFSEKIYLIGIAALVVAVIMVSESECVCIVACVLSYIPLAYDVTCITFYPYFTLFFFFLDLRDDLQHGALLRHQEQPCLLKQRGKIITFKTLAKKMILFYIYHLLFCFVSTIVS